LTVWLVGAGPGDPGLITARGQALVRSCDVLVHDRLVSPELVAQASGALIVARDGRTQEEINVMLVELGRKGLEVVRLKGGDPFVFGRGGEEAIALAEAGIPFEVVPGVSSLAAVPAAAGIPLTHRGLSAGVRVFSGRTVEPAGETVVVFMGLEKLPQVCDDLIGEGLDPATPAAVISRGTLHDQEVLVSELGQLAAEAEELEAPALVVVGEVVRLRDRLLARVLQESAV
jgi:uroporphyrin-III C-methyltransferase